MSSTDVTPVPDTTDDEFVDTTENIEDSSPTGGTSSHPKTSSSSFEMTDDDDEYELTFLDMLYHCYYHRYCWEIIKSVALFTLAIKMAQECYHLAIPMLEYEPFTPCI